MPRARARAVALALFAVSGAAALVYQVLWTRWLGLLLGTFAAATAVVVTAFMGGLALGNLLLGRTAARLAPAAALRLYAALEGGLALVAALLPALISSSSPWYTALAAASGSAVVRAALALGVLLAPTVLMGGTLPAMVRAFGAADPGGVGRLYAVNTLGAACGPLLAAFALIPALGLRGTGWAAAAVNAALAGTAWWLAARWPAEDAGPAPAPRGVAGPAPAFPYLLAGLAGFIALGFEIALTRLMVLLVTGGSVYGFAMILSAFLLGLAGGAALVRSFPPRSARAALGAFAAAQAAGWLFSLTTPFWAALPTVLVRLWWGEPPFLVLSALNFGVVLALLLAYTTASGFALPALTAAVGEVSSETVGGLFAANTLGAVAGAPLTGFVLLPSLGLDRTFALLGAAALLAGGAAAALAAGRRWPAVAVPLPVLAALGFLLPPSDPTLMNAGMYNRPYSYKPLAGENVTPAETAYRQGRIIYQKDSLTARIAIRAASPMEMAFIVNGKPDGSSSLVDMYTQILMAHLPALAHPHPRKVLVIGMGTGTTSGCLTLHPSIEEIHVAEIEPAQLDVAGWFRAHNYDVLNQPKVHVHLDDARHFLLTDPGRYDLIVSEPSNLFVTGMVNLFTAEFYRAVKAHLNPGGVFFQWIHYYRVRPDDVRGMVRTYTAVFPDTTLWVHEYGDAFLLSRDGGLAFDLREWARRLAVPALRADVRRIQLIPPEEMLGFYLWGPADLKAWAAGAPVCTDDRPYLEFTTPRVKYSVAEVRRIRAAMQARGPLEAMPLVREDAAARLRLGEMFFERGSLARAEAEFGRALALEPGSARAKERLTRLAEVRRAGEAASAGSGPLLESFH